MDSETFDDGTVPFSSEDDDRACKHDFKLDEQIGIICQLCNYVHTKIRDVMPEFVSIYCRKFLSLKCLFQSLSNYYI